MPDAMATSHTLTLSTPIPVGAMVKYHGSMVEYHGLYTVDALVAAQGPAHMVTGANAVRLVLVQGEIVLGNVRSESVSMPLLGDYEFTSRYSQAEADAINAVRQHAIRV